jgi:hypothetical protein
MGSNNVGIPPHLRAETDPVSKTLCFLASTVPDDGQGSKENPVILRIFILEKYCLLGYTAPLSVESQLAFWRNIHLHFQNRRISRARYQYERWQAELFDPEDGGDMFLRSIS